ncbi:MAG: cold shock domain-containing protein [Nitrospirae bacterium]|nr:cold shock domain-containing protein [Nitrospirota bacterium]
MPEGKVKFFDEAKGWGKIDSSNGERIFVHRTGIAGGGRTLVEGQIVTFDIVQGDKGPKAINVVVVKMGEDVAQQGNEHSAQSRPGSCVQSSSEEPQNQQTRKPVSPYNFCKRADKRQFCERKDKRTDNGQLKQKPDQLHDELKDGYYDIAFEIEWKTLTPTAVNPCQADVPENAVESIPDGYKGYNKRWLMFDCEDGSEQIKQQLAISPFTVKSAIANGFANLMGSCYRVNTKKEGHSRFEPGQYPYGGRYKRYRVSMSGKSMPGILAEDPKRDGDSFQVRIYPVTEYYCDELSFDESSLPFTPHPGDTVFARSEPIIGHKNYVKKISAEPTSECTEEVYYYGQYCFGMNRSLEGGQLGKNHYYRFYSCKTDNQNKQCVKTARIPASHFGSRKELKELVYMGSFKRLPQDKIKKYIFENKILNSGLSVSEEDEIKLLYKLEGSLYKLKGNYKEEERKRIFELFKKARYDYDPREESVNWEDNIWYENLQTLKKGHWVYYEEFDRRITNIGKNFLFKAFFLHEDTVPPGNRECNDKNLLCPRCSMFGMTEEKGEKEETEGTKETGNPNKKDNNKKVTAFRGRFKSSALICNEKLIETPAVIPVVNKDSKDTEKYETNPAASTCNVPIVNEDGNTPAEKDVPVAVWKDDQGISYSCQVLLPIQGPPKPNKRDIQGYYNEKSGQIKGAKRYLHCTVDIMKLVNETNKKREEYAHNLRNFVQVCKDEMTFSGTVGAENCNIEEIAAFIMLLESSCSNHGFKIGQGKAFGLGSVESSIKKVWIRKKSSAEPDKSYQWNEPLHRDENKEFDDFIKELDMCLSEQCKPESELSKCIKALKKSQSKQLNSIEEMNNRELFYQSDPGELRDYWKNF